MRSFLCFVSALLLLLMLIPATNAVDFFAPDWIIPANEQPYASMTASVGDTLTFAWSSGVHDVWIHPTHTCEAAGAIPLASTDDNPYTYTFGEADGSVEGNVLTFVCDVGEHCERGMYMNVTGELFLRT
jgi:plastocyanin